MLVVRLLKPTTPKSASGTSDPPRVKSSAIHSAVVAPAYVSPVAVPCTANVVWPSSRRPQPTPVTRTPERLVERLSTRVSQLPVEVWFTVALIVLPAETGKLLNGREWFGLLGDSSVQPKSSWAPLTHSEVVPVCNSPSEPEPPIPTQMPTPPFGVAAQLSVGTTQLPPTSVTTPGERTM